MTDLIVCKSIPITMNALNFTKIINNDKRSLFQHGRWPHATSKLALWCIQFWNKCGHNGLISRKSKKKKVTCSALHSVNKTDLVGKI